MKVMVIFGSKSDSRVYEPIARGLREAGAEVTVRALSAHRTPKEVDALSFDQCDVVIAGAGLAAHLPGVVAARTTSAVIGVPCVGAYEGLDSWLSIAQMPPGVPVLATGVGRGEEAVLAVRALQTAGGKIRLCHRSESAAVEKAKKILGELGVPHEEDIAPKAGAVNIAFVQADDALRSEGVTIFCPVAKESTAKDSIAWFRKAQKGLWVGLNRGDNAAIAAVQLQREYRPQLRAYKESLRQKALAADSGERK